MLAYGEGKEAITTDHVKLAVSDTDACTQVKSNRTIFIISAVMASILLCFLVFNFLTGDELL